MKLCMETATTIVDHGIAVRGDQRRRSHRMYGPERDLLVGDAVNSPAQRGDYSPHDLPPELALSDLSRVAQRAVIHIVGDLHLRPGGTWWPQLPASR